MRVTAFRGEKTLNKLADKVYDDLSPASRKKAAAALLKANPQLERIGDVEEGTVLTVPEVRGLKVKARRGKDDPAEEVMDLVDRSVEAYGKHLSERHDKHLEDLKTQSNLFTTGDFKKAIKTSPLAQELAAKAKKATSGEIRETRLKAKRVDTALEKLRKELGGR